MHVLVIERDLDIRDLLHQVLVNAGYEVSQAGGVSDAERLSRLHPDIGVVLADVRVDHPPYGLEITQKMRQRLNSHYILASGDWDVLQTEGSHDTSVLRKPYGKAELLRAVHQGITRVDAQRSPA